MSIRFAVSKPVSLLFALALFAGTDALSQNQNQADADMPQAPAHVSITQGPTIQYADDQFAVITWTTDQAFPTRVFYGKDASNLNQIAEDARSRSNAVA